MPVVRPVEGRVEALGALTSSGPADDVLGLVRVFLHQGPEGEAGKAGGLLTGQGRMRFSRRSAPGHGEGDQHRKSDREGRNQGTPDGPTARVKPPSIATRRSKRSERHRSGSSALALAFREIGEDFSDIAGDAAIKHPGRLFLDREEGRKFTLNAATCVVCLE